MNIEDINRLVDDMMSGGDRHPCVTPGCEHTVMFDDEPWCFFHSPDSGSNVPGYSYRRGDTAP